MYDSVRKKREIRGREKRGKIGAKKRAIKMPKGKERKRQTQRNRQTDRERKK